MLTVGQRIDALNVRIHAANMAGDFTLAKILIAEATVLNASNKVDTSVTGAVIGTAEQMFISQPLEYVTTTAGKAVDAVTDTLGNIGLAVAKPVVAVGLVVLGVWAYGQLKK